jgi:muramoyltetrapeptide carboxypeptidase
VRIGIVAPSRPIDRTTAERVRAFALTHFPEVTLEFHPQCFASDGGHFAGPDAERAAAFVAMANDPAIDAIWFARGGYGANRILAAAMPELGEAARGKAYCGYSDTGFLLSALYATGIGRPAHAPMVADVARDGGEAAVARTLAWLTHGDRNALEPGLDARPAVAFNLAILTALIGTPYLPELHGHIVLIEEVAEPLYRIDRMLFQLAHAGALRGLAGIRLGRFSDIQPNNPPFAETLEMIAARWCAEMGVPLLAPADIGHDAANRVVPFGADRATLS